MGVGREILGYENRVKIITCRVTPQGTGAPTSPLPGGQFGKGIKSVTRTGVGTIQIVTDLPFQRHLSVVPTITAGSLSAYLAEVTSVTPGTGTIVITTGQYQVANPLPANGTPVVVTVLDLPNSTEINVDIVVSHSDI